MVQLIPLKVTQSKKVILCIANKMCVEINWIRQLNTKIGTTQVHEKRIR